MKRSLVKTIATFALVGSLAGCVSAPVQINKPAEDVIYVIPELMILGNKYSVRSAESKDVKIDLGIAIGIATGDIIVEKKENGTYRATILNHPENYLEKEPVLLERICEMADVEPKDNIVTKEETLGLLIYAFEHPQYCK